MCLFVTERDIDYGEILRRGGQNGGDEDFAFLRCPSCSYLYLIDYEVDTVYTDVADLSRRVAFGAPGDVVVCVGCGQPLQAEQIWAALRGDAGMQQWQVEWDRFQQSPWAWAAKRKV